jgi:UDP-N-acetylglucosamine enolpyruvyl transferase
MSSLDSAVRDVKQQVEGNAAGKIVLANQMSQEQLWLAMLPSIAKVEELSKSVEDIAARVSMIDQ